VIAATWSPIKQPAAWARFLTVIAATLLAFVIGRNYAISKQETDVNGTRAYGQRMMMPAVNYACTGRFGEIRLAPDATPDDTTAVGKIRQFLEGIEPNYTCASFPQHLMPTSLLDGIDWSNANWPMYLTLVYGILWRWLGATWQVTFDIVGGVVPLSFLALYFCLRPFLHSLVSAAAALLFICNPFYISFTLFPRDSLKFPFFIGIAALIIAIAAPTHAPRRFLVLASLLGLSIGVGFGFRSDLLLFLAPALVVLLFVCRVEIGLAKLSLRSRVLLQGLHRAAAVAVLLVSFAVGGWLPLLNDYVLHEHLGEVGYHPLLMGLQGYARSDQFQREIGNTGMYMFRNAYNSDLGIAVRVMEFAQRKYGASVTFDDPSYWLYAKRYYFEVVSLVPADMISGVIGTFVNLMTEPYSFRFRQTVTAPLSRDDLEAPWEGAYAFARGSYLYRTVATRLDHLYAAVSLNSEGLFAANVIVFAVFLALVAVRFGIRATIATLIVIGIILTVVSLRFEMRHNFYVFVVPYIAWVVVIGTLIGALVGTPATIRLARDAVRKEGAAAMARLKPPAASVLAVAVLLFGIIAGAIGALLVARSYQARTLLPLMADWARRPTVPAETELSQVDPGTTRIRIVSPMPLSSGGERQPGAPVTPRIQMGVVAVELDGQRCPDRRMYLGGIGSSNYTDDTTFMLFEGFSFTIPRGQDYLAFLPAFYYLQGSATMEFAGVQTEAGNVPCVKSVGLVTHFARNDVLFDFVFPKDLSRLRRSDLFQEVLIPGLGYL